VGEHPSEDLAESGYTPDMKAKKIKIINNNNKC
jgi:hypothetical protein